MKNVRTREKDVHPTFSSQARDPTLKNPNFQGDHHLLVSRYSFIYISCLYADKITERKEKNERYLTFNVRKQQEPTAL